jgi:hypothetical protein
LLKFGSFIGHWFIYVAWNFRCKIFTLHWDIALKLPGPFFLGHTVYIYRVTQDVVTPPKFSVFLKIKIWIFGDAIIVLVCIFWHNTVDKITSGFTGSTINFFILNGIPQFFFNIWVRCKFLFKMTYHNMTFTFKMAPKVRIFIEPIEARIYLPKTFLTQ